MTIREAIIGGVKCRLEAHGDRILIKTTGGNTKPAMYTWRLDTREWVGKPPYYAFAEQLITGFGL
jgi:hypothetical protein